MKLSPRLLATAAPLRRIARPVGRSVFAARSQYSSSSASSSGHPEAADRAQSQAQPQHTQPNPAQPTPPPQKTHYTLFPLTLPQGPPPAGPFTIDLPSLRREYLRLQAAAHPDVHSGPAKARAESASAVINDAYTTLRDPLRRAEYILSLHGIDTKKEGEKMGGGLGLEGVATGGGIEDMEFLDEIMEVREAVEEAGEGDIEGLKGENQTRVERCEERLGGFFEREDWEGARGEVVRLRYWRGIGERLVERA
ncbi:hypothetical protein V498_09275 [Pseudogymnoascus sp. VKM F-4517 (FW-2822)]|nr:hypothetical protein V498_09275 [Pseudogymnoascus sp. VKM F-4517 (FW-2822)]